MQKELHALRILRLLSLSLSPSNTFHEETRVPIGFHGHDLIDEALANLLFHTSEINEVGFRKL